MMHRYRPRRLYPIPDPDAWAAYEEANGRAADEYPIRVRRNAYPGCAGDCGRVVNAAGRVCVVCREAR